MPNIQIESIPMMSIFLYCRGTMPRVFERQSVRAWQQLLTNDLVSDDIARLCLILTDNTNHVHQHETRYTSSYRIYEWEYPHCI